MRLTGERLPFGRMGRPASPWRILAYLAAIGAGLMLLRSFQAREVRALVVAPLMPAVAPLVHDWAAAASGGVERDRLLKEAEESAVRALQLDPGSPLALAYYAELLLDEGKFAQAFDLAEQAAAQTDPFDPLWLDVHRACGYLLVLDGD